MQKMKSMNGKKIIRCSVSAKNGQEIRDMASRPWILVCFGFTAFMSFLLSPLFLQQTEPLWDARDWAYPAFSYLADSIAEGRFPLWDPYTNCGLPFHADPNSPTLNPVALFFGYFIHDSAIGYSAFWAFHWIWGGIGMILLTRHFDGKPMGGLLAAATYTLSGFFIGHAEHITFIIVAGWLPWIVWFADKAVLTSNKGWALLGGFSLGMASLGGYPGLVSFTGLAVAIWLVLRFLPAWGLDIKAIPLFRERMFRIISTLVIIAVVSLVVWSPVLNAFFTEGSGYTDRVTSLSPEVANYGNTFTLPAIFSFIFPYATIAGRAWMGSDISGTNGYVGILTVPLAVLWWWNERKRQRHWWIVIFIVFMFLLSFGGQAGLRTLLYYIFPPMQFNRHSAPFRLYWILPVTLMAGLGFSHFQSYLKNLRTVRSIFSGWFVIALFASIVLIYFLSSHRRVVWEDYTPRPFIPTMLILLLCLLIIWAKQNVHGFLLRSRMVLPLVMLLMIADMAGHLYNNSFTPRLFMPAMLILPLCLVIVWANENVRGFLLRSRLLLPLVMTLVIADMTWHLYNNSLTVWSSGDSTRQTEGLRLRTTQVQGEPGPRLPPNPFGFFNAQQVLKRPAVKAYAPMISEGFDGVLCNSRFAAVLQSSTRFWINPGMEQIPDRATALSILSSTGAGDPVPAFVEQKTGAPSAVRMVPGSYGKATVLSYAPENIVMEVEVPPGSEGFLSSTERYAPGWKAWIDGMPGKVIKTNLYFRGMAVPPGRHRIIWKYEPARWLPLVWASFATLFISAAAGMVLVQRRYQDTTALWTMPVTKSSEQQ